MRRKRGRVAAISALHEFNFDLLPCLIQCRNAEFSNLSGLEFLRLRRLLNCAAFPARGEQKLEETEQRSPLPIVTQPSAVERGEDLCFSRQSNILASSTC